MSHKCNKYIAIWTTIHKVIHNICAYLDEAIENKGIGCLIR